MRLNANKSGFTLLEIIIVIIIIGVLASLALPRLFATVEYSRSAEALSAIATIRSAMERCYLQQNGSYTQCNIDTTASPVNSLDIEPPDDSPNAHFEYQITDSSKSGYTITAYRNSTENGDGDNDKTAGSAIRLIVTDSTIKKCSPDQSKNFYKSFGSCT